jgi:tRNA pseudouridine55 synthase
VIRVRCSKGTYIRVLAEDIGQALGCGAHLAHLRRTASGELSLADGVSFDVLASMTELERDRLLLPCDALLQALPRVELEEGDAVRLQHGQPVLVSPAASLGRGGPLRAYRGKTFLGLVDAVDGQLSARRLMAQQASSSEMLVA